MPRKARIDGPGALNHVIVRGIEGRKIFRSDSDRQNFLDRTGRLILETQTDCFAWALLSNHAHLLLKTGLIPISILMSRLLTGYAVWFNRKYRRHGQLFQNRYKSILCQEDLYLKELVRYIHLNPMRAREVADMKSLNQHPWCGHSVLMSKIKQEWQNIDYIYELFSSENRIAQRKYQEFVKKGIPQGKRSDLSGGGLLRSIGGWTAVKELRKSGIRVKGDERILGDSDFVEAILRSAGEELEQKYELKAKGYDFNRVVQRVAEVMSMGIEEVTAFGKSPQTVKARSLLCFWANRKLGMTTIEIGKKLNLSQSAVSRSSLRGEKIARENRFELIEEDI